MLLNLRLLTVIAVMAASGITYAQSSGTAFIVAPGLLVTNHHVIDGCGAIEVIASDGRRPVTVVDSVEQIDLALLRVYGLRGGVASLRTKSATLLGESATVFGFPLGGALSSTGNFTTGVVSSLRGLRDAAGEIQITAPVQPGNSGGPVLDRSGAVIGVVQSKLDALKAVRATGDIPQNVNFAVSLDVLADFLEKNKVPFKSAERQPAIETTQVAEMAQSFTYKISCTRASRTAVVPKPKAPAPTLNPPVTMAPAPAAPTTPAPSKLVQDIQTALNLKGFNAGPADGFIGPQTQAAISSAQKALGLPVSGQPSNSLLAGINRLLNQSTNSSASVARHPSNPSTGFMAKVRSCVNQNMSNQWANANVSQNVAGNPSVSLSIYVDRSGRASVISIMDSSGIIGFDNAVVAGIQRCYPFPDYPKVSWPSKLNINYRLYD
jgi:TonB family protein